MTMVMWEYFFQKAIFGGLCPHKVAVLSATAIFLQWWLWSSLYSNNMEEIDNFLVLPSSSNKTQCTIFTETFRPEKPDGFVILSELFQNSNLLLLWQNFDQTDNKVQWTLVIVNAWIVNHLSIVNVYFWWHRLFYNINYMLNSKFHKICQPLISKLKFWIFPLFYHICYAIYVNKRLFMP